VTEQQQAVIAEAAVRAVEGNAAIRALFWYTDRDLGTDRATAENFYGLWRADGTPKPAYSTLRSAVAALRRS
jgi:hypothetical protein